MNETIITDGLGSVRTEAAPRRTITAYKLMRLVDGKLYPLYIDRSEPVELGVWYNADSVSKTTLEKLPFGYHLIDLKTEKVIDSRQSKPKLAEVKAATAHNWRWFYVVQMKTKIGYKNVGIAESKGEEQVKAEYALRPGWHAGQLPVMNQVAKGANKDILDDSFVFTEIEISADVDYNAEARANGGELYYIPENGYYLRCTNANKKAAQADKLDWYIAGAIRINRIISDSEARDIIDRYNREHGTHVAYSVPRESGKMFDADTMSLEGCLNGTNDFYALFSDDNDLLVDFGVGWNRRDVRRKAVEYMKEHNIQSAFIEITDCEGEIKDTIDIDLGLQGTKKADSDAGDFCLEIKISKNSLPLSSDKIAAAGSLRGFLRAAKIAACPSGKQPLAGSATPTPRVTANIKDIQDSIAIYEEKIKNWEKSPITNELAFLLYVLTKLPHEASKNQSYYVIEENGSFRIRFSGHNAIARYLNKNERYKVGITFQSKDTPITFEPFYNVYYKEHVYYTEYLASEILRDILQGIVDVLKGGFYNVPCDLPLYSPDEKKYKEHFGLQGLGEPASDAECRAVLGALLKDWIPDIKNVDKYLIDNCKIRLIRGFGDSFDRYLEERGLKNVFIKGSGENGTMIYSITDRNDQQNINYIKDCIGFDEKESKPKPPVDEFLDSLDLSPEQRDEIRHEILAEILGGAHRVEQAIENVRAKHPELWQTQTDEKISLLEMWTRLKAKHSDRIFLFREGDFYTAYFGDAIMVARTLNVTLTQSGNTKMASFPQTELDTYLPKLVKAGLRVAIADELPKEVLTEEEKAKLRSYSGKGGSKDTTERGILDEYYTPDYVCEFMYQLAVRYGYTAGKVLEPSCATGNCIRPIYERNDYTHIDAFEINQTSREICKKLYPYVKIYENYFETAFLEPPRYTFKAKKTWLENAPYDLIIGNPPYGKHVNRYSSYFKGKDRFAQVEMFFMYKCLELLRSGGLLVFITSINFMSTGSAYQETKNRIGEIAELVDAYRLPKVFEKTDICTDIIVLRKK